jgi:hypothetical protein
MGLSFAIAAGPRQGSHSRFPVPRDSRPYFTVSDSRLPQPGRAGPRICIPQGQGGPVITPGTGFPFRRLIRLAGLRWRYSTSPPRGELLPPVYTQNTIIYDYPGKDSCKKTILNFDFRYCLYPIAYIPNVHELLFKKPFQNRNECRKSTNV